MLSITKEEITMLGKKSQTILVAILSILFCLSSVSNGVFIDIQDGLFVVNATMENDTLHVSIVAETIGYVAFGPSPEGMMTGSDVIIAGYDPITQTSYIGVLLTYFSDKTSQNTRNNTAN